jgi:hypothetical protein
MVMTEYTVTAPDLGSATNLAMRRAHAEGFTRVSVMSTRQTGRSSFVIVCFVSN